MSVALAVRNRCARCTCRLASDNDSSMCSPCRRAHRVGYANAALRLDPGAVKAAFDRGGVPAIADELGCRPEEAVAGAVACGLLPARYLRRIEVLAQLLGLADLSHIAAAERTGLSRWTVATYRRELDSPGQQRHP